MNTFTKIAIAVSAGVVAGAAVGILIAPDKGSETIRRINKRSKEFVDSMKDEIEKMTHKCSNMAGGVSKAAKEKVEEFV